MDNSEAITQARVIHNKAQFIRRQLDELWDMADKIAAAQRRGELSGEVSVGCHQRAMRISDAITSLEGV